MQEVGLRQQPYQRATRSLTEHFITSRPHTLNTPPSSYHHPDTVAELEALLQRCLNFMYIYAPLNAVDLERAINIMTTNGQLSQLVIITNPAILKKYAVVHRPLLFKSFKNLTIRRNTSDIGDAIKAKPHRRMTYGIHYFE